MLPRLRAAVLVLLSVTLLATCGGEGEPSAPVPAGLALSSPPWTNIINGTAFALTAQVVDADGDPVEAPGIPVELQVTLGSAVLTGTASGVSDANGAVLLEGLALTGPSASTQLTLSSDSLPGVASPIFTLKVGAAASFTKISGDSQTVVTHDTVAVMPVVEIRDVGQNPVPSVVVRAQVLLGGGSVIGPTGVSGAIADYPTDAAGRARVRWVAGGIGENRVSVQVLGRPELGTITLTSTSTVDAPWRYETVSQLNLLPVVDVWYDTAARVTVTDKYGNRIAGAPVRFYNPDGDINSMSFVGDTGVTDSVGEFVLAAWRPGTVKGAYRIGARPGPFPQETEYASFSVGPAAFARLEVPPAMVVGRGTIVRFGFHAVDRFGNRVPTPTATVTKLSGDGTFTLDAPADGDFPVNFTAPATAGTTIFRATSPELPDSTFDATIHTVAPTAVRRVAGDSQAVRAGSTPPLPFTVRVVDTAEAPVAGVPLSLMDPFSGAFLQTIASDSAGLVVFAPFAQPIAVGYRPYNVHSPLLNGGGTSLVLNVRLLAGPPFAIVQQPPVMGDTIYGEVGEPIVELPRAYVYDADELPVEGAVVRFSTTQGDLLADSALTDQNGFATVPGWTLDTVAGLQQVTAELVGLGATQLRAVARPGPASTLSIVSSGSAEGFVGERLGRGVIVEGRDRYGNLAAARQATGSVESGDASVIGGSIPLSRDGRAYVDLWTLGATPGPNTLRVAVDSAEVSFVATAIPAAPFSIVLRGSIPPGYAGYFTHAAYTWRRRITADVPDLTVNIGGGQCASFQGAVNGTVDDLIIDVSIGTIDGPGGILGGATPCFIRTASQIPLLGAMQFDIADLGDLEQEGTVSDVILHEMGHVLGIGSLWSTRGLVTNPGTINPQYTGAGGMAGWAEIGGVPLGVTTVPVEGTGGPGTANVHWRETIMPSELMTGYLSAAVNPLSAVTLRSLQDLGYTVDTTMADPYTVMTAPSPVPGRPPVRIQDLVGRPKFTVDPNGRIRPIE